ncbi:MAG TPA: hypothetical protein VN832_13965 [Stellaceae bacterium]|nr:hypothetical protein [Stellaceae bacterium]
MTPRRRLMALTVLIGLAACSTIAPFEAAQPADDEYAVCYARIGATPQQVRQLVVPECAAGSEPRLVSQAMDLAACPLFTPIRAVFKCAAR